MKTNPVMRGGAKNNMKIFLVIFIVIFIATQFIVIMQTWINVKQSAQIRLLSSKVICLEMDKLYTGDEWCVEK